ncbi:MAG: AAA family ATPase [Deltaproteobacteria bacterium]|nr:AAA family ATPase [Deltaproteobacteria bacterium]TLN04440.1 MAG: AAA family ATPase [bacterium]
MYCEHFGFKESPFTITPNPRFIFFSKNHREAFAHLFYGITNRVGFMELTGEVGTGKTTVLRTVLSQIDDDSHRIALILNPCLSGLELMRSINREFDVPCEGLSSSELLQELNRFLLAENAAGRTVVLVIDEAQNLEPQVLEQIRLISNLETETAKLIQIVLAGQPELGTLLERKDLRQLSQRIAVRYHLRAMDFADTQAYIGHRLEVAGGRFAANFTAAALKKVYRFSGGYPRLINIVCDRSLLIAFGESKHEVSARDVATAITEIRRVQNDTVPVARIRLLLAAVLILCLGFAGYLYQKNRMAVASLSSVQRKPVPIAESVAADAPLESDSTQRNDPSRLTERDSARQAFGVIAGLWGSSSSASEQGKAGLAGFLVMARQSDLQVSSVRTNLEFLYFLDVPVILEVNIPGVTGKRYLVLTGRGQGTAVVQPSLRGKSSLTGEELNSIWTGRCYFVWKNFRKIPFLPSPEAQRREVLLVQQMLVKAGFAKAGKSGIFDGATVSALKEFQKARGLAADGKLGIQTLLLLYRYGGSISVPRLEKRGGGYQG